MTSVTTEEPQRLPPECTFAEHVAMERTSVSGYVNRVYCGACGFDELVFDVEEFVKKEGGKPLRESLKKAVTDMVGAFPLDKDVVLSPDVKPLLLEEALHLIDKMSSAPLSVRAGFMSGSRVVLAAAIVYVAALNIEKKKPREWSSFVTQMDLAVLSGTSEVSLRSWTGKVYRNLVLT